MAPATVSPFLGFAFFLRDQEVKVRLDPKAKAAAKMRPRRLTGRSWRVSMDVWIGALYRFSRALTAYSALADTPSVFEELDAWLRRRLRQVRWKEWKKRTGRLCGLVALGSCCRRRRAGCYDGLRSLLVSRPGPAKWSIVASGDRW